VLAQHSRQAATVFALTVQLSQDTISMLILRRARSSLLFFWGLTPVSTQSSTHDIYPHSAATSTHVLTSRRSSSRSLPRAMPAALTASRDKISGRTEFKQRPRIGFPLNSDRVRRRPSPELDLRHSGNGGDSLHLFDHCLVLCLRYRATAILKDYDFVIAIVTLFGCREHHAAGRHTG
jgi:hypothetical protein